VVRIRGNMVSVHQPTHGFLTSAGYLAEGEVSGGMGDHRGITQTPEGKKIVPKGGAGREDLKEF